MKQFEHNGFLFVEVPEDATNFVIDDELYYQAKFNDYGAVSHMKKLPPGNWQILSKANECSEDQAKGIVEQQRGNGLFKNYSLEGSLAQYGTYFLNRAIESLTSLILSHELKLENVLILKKEK